MDHFNKNLDQLGLIKRELLEPFKIWQLVRKLKKRALPLSIKTNNDSLKLTSSPGLYYFEARFNFSSYEELDAFGDAWGKIRRGKVPVGISRYYPNRAKKHKHRISRNAFIPFYLGKREDISDRIISHLDGSEDSDTYSLKLRSRPEIIEGIEFRYSYYPFNISKDSYFGVEVVEKELRELLNPIIGRQ